MLIGLAVRDVVLIDSLELSFAPGLTVLTGETGAGKSIILGALGLATGVRSEAAMVRRGASQAIATATFSPPADHAVWTLLDEKGLRDDAEGTLVLRRTIGVDGRTRAFVNDQAAGVALLRELGAMLMEVHGQHETVGLLDARAHRSLLDDFGGLGPELAQCAQAWTAWLSARKLCAAAALRGETARNETLEIAANLEELDRLAPRAGEEDSLASERAILGGAEKALAEIASARECLGGEAAGARLGQALRALERAGERLAKAGADAQSAPARLVATAAEAIDRALAETAEACAGVDAAAASLDFEPGRLERAEERLFALRAASRKFGAPVDGLAALRADLAGQLSDAEDADEAGRTAAAEEEVAREAFGRIADRLTAARREAGDRLAAAVEGEMIPLKLEKARFRVAVEPLAEERAGPDGADRVEFQISTLPGAPFASLASIASGGELARFALALKVSLASRSVGAQPLMIFDEVDQGVGGAVADAVGVRLKRLAAEGQVIVVTHSPQVAARADAHWRVQRGAVGGEVRASVEDLGPGAREEEIARMLSGARITDAARAAARALMHA